MRTARRAFSLIELLIVVAIIALLISILLPAMSAARDQARRARCASGLRQVAHGWASYLTDYGGTFPSHMTNLRWFYGGKVQAYAVGGSGIINPRPINPYLGLDGYGNRTAEVFRCPFDKGAIGLYDPAANGVTTYDYMGTSYPMNAAFTPSGRRPIRLTDVRLPDSLVVLAGDHQSVWTPIFNGPSRFQAYWHDDVGTHMNLAFLDGHAAFLELEWGKTYTARYSLDLAPPTPEDDPPAPSN